MNLAPLLLMHQPDVTYVVSSESSEKLRIAKELVTEKVRLDNVHTSVLRAKHTVFAQNHRLKDYFRSVRVIDSDQDQQSFRVTFTPLEDADRYWKDIVVHVVLLIKAAGVSIRFEKAGDVAR